MILYSAWHQKAGAKYFITGQNFDCQAQHLKKLLKRSYTQHDTRKQEQNISSLVKTLIVKLNT